nr:hypothetical membrane protein [uncultured archaeon]
MYIIYIGNFLSIVVGDKIGLDTWFVHMTKEEDPKEEKPPRFTVEVLDKLTALMITGFGLVAALAWNDAIKLLFKEVFGMHEALWAMFAYAIFVTILIVLITIYLSRLLRIAKEKEK